MLKVILILAFLIASNPILAKSKCEDEWNALKSIQSQMRQRSTEYLRVEEHKKHDEYQNCRKGKTNNKNSEGKNSQKKYSTSKKYYLQKKLRNSFNSSAVNMKTKFKGEKQQAWLDYYTTPKDCISPKSTAKFAKCLDERDNKAIEFDLNWKDE